MSKSFKQIETSRLVLRAWEPSDAEELIRIAGQEHIEYWLPDWREYDKHAKGWIKWVRRNYELDNPMEQFVSWAITLKDGGNLIGQIAIGRFDKLSEKEIGITYLLDAAHTRRGYMTEAVKAVAKYAFDGYGYDHLIATIQPENYASRRVAEKAGFRYIKTIEILDDGQTEVLPFRYYWLDKLDLRLPIKTQRLIISKYNENMAESMHRTSLDEDNRLFVPDEVFETIDDAQEILDSLIANYGKKSVPLVYPVLLHDGTHIGHVEAVPLKTGWEIGYHIAKPHTGNGFATEALRAFLSPIMEHLEIKTISGICRADNAASRKVLEKCGFVLESERVASYHGEKHLLCYYWYEHKAVEEMSAFFNARAGEYDSHMLASGDWQYKRLADALPSTDRPLRVLDIGCGTGIELDFLWTKIPNAHITCVDLSRGMLDLLLKNHPDHHDQVTVVEASYVDWSYPENEFDLVVSNQTMHHFLPDMKTGIYRKILGSLKPGGIYIEGDFMVDELTAEQYLQRYETMISDMPSGASPGEYHIDIPFTVETQKGLLRDAGFGEVEALTRDIRKDWSYAVLRASKEMEEAKR